jgi:hypothetical protein
MVNEHNGSTSAATRRAADDWIETFARVGYVAKGVVYAVVGVLALQFAAGSGGSTTGTRGAIREIASGPFGQILLGLTAIGLACYAVWRLVMATLDLKDEGGDTEGTVKRIGYAASGFVNLALAFYAAQILTGPGGGGSSKQELTAQLMSQPFGLWLIGLIGATIIGVGAYHFYKAANATFMKRYKVSEMDHQTRKWVKRIGQWGIAARGVVFSIVGFFLIQAAMQADPSETKGLGGALDTLIQQPYGPWVLGVVAAGLVAYAVYCFSYARYRYFHTQPS